MKRFGTFFFLRGEHLDRPNRHGSRGCTLKSDSAHNRRLDAECDEDMEHSRLAERFSKAITITIVLVLSLLDCISCAHGASPMAAAPTNPKKT